MGAWVKAFPFLPVLCFVLCETPSSASATLQPILNNDQVGWGSHIGFQS